MARFRARDLVVHTKPDRTPVTEADHAVEEAVRDLLGRARPDDGVVGEEYGSPAPGRRRWIVDPIDGTKSFLRGSPPWATLLGLEVDGELVLGMVSAPALGPSLVGHPGRRRLRQRRAHPGVRASRPSTTPCSATPT